MKKVTPAQHRKMLKKLSRQPFVLATSATLPYLPHLPPDTVIRAHKLIAGDMGPGYRRGGKSLTISYRPGTTTLEPDANTNELDACGAGLNVGTVQWCRYCYMQQVGNVGGLLLAEVEFRRKDVAVFPCRSAYYGNQWRPMHNGKFRTTMLRVLSVSVLSEDYITDCENPGRRLSEHLVRPKLDAAIFEPKRKKARK